MRSFFEEFKKFIMRGNVVDLAIGIVIGAAFTAIVNSMVKDIFMPVIGLLTGGFDVSPPQAEAITAASTPTVRNRHHGGRRGHGEDIREKAVLTSVSSVSTVVARLALPGSRIAERCRRGWRHARRSRVAR